MRTNVSITIAGSLLASSLALAPCAHSHATYNLSGYDAGISGSTNGSDGSPTGAPSATWTDGPVDDYAGGLPVNWYAGMHSAASVRVMQTGATEPHAAGSLLAAIESYNATNDPDVPEDRVLAVGALSWSDPGWLEGQGWGHALDFGLLHVTPLETILANGAVNLILDLADDPTDAIAMQLAFAMYGGWDTNAASVRHQTFFSTPAPGNNPLGATGLTLIAHGVATAPGQALNITVPVDATYDGHYTVIVGAVGSVAGPYAMTVSTAAAPADGDADGVVDTVDNCVGLANPSQDDRDGDDVGDACDPFPDHPNNELAQCDADMGVMAEQLAQATADADGDGTRDPVDACPETPAGAITDSTGCSQQQFCAGVDVSTKAGKKACEKSDWRNDEPLLKKQGADCRYDKGPKGSVAEDRRCAAAQ